MKHAGVTRSGPDQVQPGSMSKGVASEAVYQKCSKIPRLSRFVSLCQPGSGENSAVDGGNAAAESVGLHNTCGARIILDTGLIPA